MDILVANNASISPPVPVNIGSKPGLTVLPERGADCMCEEAGGLAGAGSGFGRRQNQIPWEHAHYARGNELPEAQASFKACKEARFEGGS